jgi:hypothetical protein
MQHKPRLITFLILLVIILYIHLAPHPENSNIFFHFYNGLLTDILLPSYLYIMCTVAFRGFFERIKNRKKFLIFRALIAAAILFSGFFVETAQYFGNDFLGFNIRSIRLLNVYNWHIIRFINRLLPIKT